MRNAILAVALLALLVSGCQRRGEPDPADSPAAKARPTHRYNVLLVTLDTTRVDYLSCYDPQKAGLTPNLDAIAADGIRFERAMAQAPTTPMSHASILTGLNPYEHGLRVLTAASGYRLDEKIPRLNSVLKQHGWTTAAFLSSFTVSEYYGFDFGFDVFDSGVETDPAGIVELLPDGRKRWNQRRHQRRSDETTDRVLEWLSQAPAEPFFLWIHYWDPHDRMVLAPPEILRRFVKPGMKRETPPWKEAIYRAEIHYVDMQFARVIDALRQRGLYDNTIIVIVADHGQGLGQHGWWAHRLLYQEDLHVPLIMRIPGWPTGRVVPELVRTIDIYPTVMEALGLPVGSRVSGRSLRGLIEGRSEPPRWAYAEAINKFDEMGHVVQRRPKADLLYAAIERDWKFLFRYSYPDESELYHLADDPHELVNLYQQEPAQVRRLKALLDACKSYVTRPFGPTTGNLAALEHLQALGYVGGGEEDEEEEPPPATQPTSAPASAPAPVDDPNN